MPTTTTTTTSHIPQDSPNNQRETLNHFNDLTSTSDRSSISKSQPYTDSFTKSNGPPVKVIFINRDYSHGDGVRFSTNYPEELKGYLDKEHFDEIVETINNLYENAEKLSPFSVIESILGCLTAYILFLVIDTQYDRALKKISKYIDQQNYNLRRSGITLVDPMARGLRCMEIRIDNPASSSFSE